MRALLYWEVEPTAIAEVGESTFMLIADTMAQNEAATLGVKIIGDREITKSDDGKRVILVWNVEEVK